MMNKKSTHLGSVQDVNGTTVSVSLSNESLTGFIYVDGHGYRIGQVGSFVKIPIGFINLYGIISQIGASSIPESKKNELTSDNKWITIQLVGEGNQNGVFQRGISQYPTIGDNVHLVSEKDLEKIYGQPDKPYFVKIGHIANAESIPALVDVNKLINRHSAVLGTTGSGKSTTVVSLINALASPENYPSSRIIILDIHGEYENAFKKDANIFKINSDGSSNEKELYIPFWALNFDELCEISFGEFNNEKDKNIVLERVQNCKYNSTKKYEKAGINLDSLDVDSPLPFSLNHLWHKLYIETFGTYYKNKDGEPIDNLAYEYDSDGRELKGDPLKGIPPIFKNVKNDKDDSEKINYLPKSLNLGKQLQLLGSKLRIPRYNFLFKPGDWKPEEDGKISKDLDSLLKNWIGHKKRVTILDLSGVPTDILHIIIGVLLRILYEAVFWSRNLSQGGRQRPLLIVMEEAHLYLNNNELKSIASKIVQRIVKEGRKYGIGAMVVSQRPSEINATVLSQCGTFFALRLSNNTDRGHVSGTVSDNLEGLTNMLPILRTGEAIILGEAVKLPMRTMIEAPPRDRRPDSQDPIVYDEIEHDKSKNPGGWGIKMEENPNYEEVLQVWRSQNPIISKIKKINIMNRKKVISSNVASVGYDKNSQTLEVEFSNGSVYQYFDVPEQKYTCLINADSVGSCLNKHIKGVYRYSKI